MSKSSAGSPTVWTEVAQLLPIIGSGNSQEMGAAVGLSSDLIFVGAPKANVAGLARGRVYVFPIKASYANQERPTSTLENEGGKADDKFGRALVLSGGSAVIGVPEADLVLSNSSQLSNVGRADAFQLEKLFADGLE